MHPEKEAKYILTRFIEMWGYRVDGWNFSCTWKRERGDYGEWRLRAWKILDGRLVDVHGYLTYDEWHDHHHNAVDELSEVMYLNSFKEPASA